MLRTVGMLATAHASYRIAVGGKGAGQNLFCIACKVGCCSVAGGGGCSITCHVLLLLASCSDSFKMSDIYATP